MEKTPEEIAKTGSNPEKQQWLLHAARTPRDILRFINAGTGRDSHEDSLATHVLYVRIGEIAELYTRRIVCLTIALLIFTVALFAVEIRAVFFPKDSRTHIEAKQPGQNHQAMIPGITN